MPEGSRRPAADTLRADRKLRTGAQRGAEDGGKDSPATAGHQQLTSEVVKSRSRFERITERYGNGSPDIKDGEKYHGGPICSSYLLQRTRITLILYVYIKLQLVV